jgi:uncharacterized protein
VVKTGDIVKVQVVEVDVARKRIALTMKLGDALARKEGPLSARSENRFEGAGPGQRQRSGGQGKGYTLPPAKGSAMASAFAKLQNLKK